MSLDLILVTGAPRSGVSIVAGVLGICGGWIGGAWPMKKFDGRGSFENKEVRSAVVTPFMRGIRSDPYGRSPLPSTDRCKRISERVRIAWRRRVDGIVSGQGRLAEMPVVLPSITTCCIWPVWAAAFPEAKWVIVRRPDEDIVRSCINTGFMDQFDSRPAWAAWVGEYTKKFEEIGASGLPAVELWPQEALGGDLTKLRALVEGLGLAWDTERVADFMAPITWKGGVFTVTD